MTKQAAYGTLLKMGVGDVQIETATVLGTITAIGAGNAEVVITATGMSGTPLTLAVPVANDDTAVIVAGKIRTFLANDATAAAVVYLFEVSGTGADVVLTRRIPAATIANLNIAIHDGTCDGLTTADVSTGTHAGETTFTSIAQVQNISGPALALDTEDVTTHDSTAAFEEVVATILRTGELSLDIVYDPNAATHNATAGLVQMLETQTLCGFNLIFPGPYQWDFAAYVTGFEPSAAHDGALTATVSLKLTGAPTLV